MPPPHNLILDTGPLVLLTLSIFYGDPPRVLGDQLVRNYTAEQLERLQNALEIAHKVLLSPYCLAESTNLIRRQDQRQVLAKVAGIFEPCREETTAILRHSRLPQLGVADVSLLLLAQQPGTYTLTADRDLYGALCDSDCTVIYFCVEPGRQYVVAYPA